MVPQIIKTEAVCETWFRTLLAKQQEGVILSVFDRAANFDFSDGITSVLCRGRSLQPYSCRTSGPITFSEIGLRPGMQVRADANGIQIEDRWLITFEGSDCVDMNIQNRVCPEGYGIYHPDAEPVLFVLKEIGDENGLSNLATGTGSNVYADLIRPRLPVLFEAIKHKNGKDAAEAAGRIAGCGVGLTPSSDDLLNGYFCILQAKACLEKDSELKGIIRSAADAAAEKTNRISGTFLSQVGKGMASEDVLNLLHLIYSDTDAERIRRAAKRVAEFGSTSGTDTLAGIVLAVKNHYGGKYSG